MTVDVPEAIEVRIAKADLMALADGLQGAGAAYRHDSIVTKALSVRLRAPEGGFWIETTSPETQWIENNHGLLSDDFASWRWTVTPQLRGETHLQLIVSARTVGTDGVAAETALPDQIIEHTKSRKQPRVIISDERDHVLGTGGAVVKALPLLGNAPFFHLNADTMWIDGVRPNLARLAEAFDPTRMDILLLMAPTTSSIVYSGRVDYSMLPDGALRKRRELQVVPFVYAGAAIMSPSLFADAPDGEFPLTKMFDRANEQERLFGLRLDGVWMHVGTPDAVQAAEEAFLESVA